MSVPRPPAHPDATPPADTDRRARRAAGSAPTLPGRLPLLGHVLRLLRAPVPALQALRSHGPVVVVYLGRRPVYVVNAPHLVHRVLVTEHDTVGRGRVFAKLRQYTGDGIATAEGAFHLRQRRIIRPAFHHDRFHAYADVMQTQTAALAGTWRPGQHVPVETAMAELASTIVSTALCRADGSGQAAAEIRRYIPILERGMMWRTLSPSDRLDALPMPGNRRFRHAQARLRQVVGDLVHAYLADPADRGDLLSTLVRSRDPDTGQGMSRHELTDHVIVLLVAGSNTSATVLTWLWHELGRNPMIEARVHHEIDTVLAGRPVTFGDVARLDYTQRLVKETLRLHCPVWLSMRRTTAPLDLDGVRVPAGADLIYSPVTMHRDPELYPRPMRLDPDRWLPERAAHLPRHAYIPFGNGRYKCLGDHFVLTEATVVLATIGARWRLTPSAGHHVREVAEITLHADRVPMTAVPRH